MFSIKVFKVHVKHSGRSVEVGLTPDTSVLQLKEKICSEFNVAPDRQILHCNGKLLEADDSVSIKQAKIPNGSKILCTVSQSPADPVMERLQKIGSQAEDPEESLDQLVKRRKLLSKESVKVGELMRLLESLDSIDCIDQSHRAKRKELATKINSFLDRNDKLGSKLNRDSKS